MNKATTQRQHTPLDRMADNMTQFHPDTHWLAEYVSGSLPEAQALCIATHLEFCPQCRADINALTEIGASLFSATDDTTPLNPQVLDAVWQSITPDNNPPPAVAIQAESHPTSVPAYPDSFPRALRKLIPDGTSGLPWKNIGSRLSVAKLHRIDAERDVSLHRLQPGGVVSDHDHGGREITVVLSGSFSDQNGQYHPGDFLVREPGETHRPTASEDNECICLAVCDAPVKFTGLFSRLLNPLVALQHRH